MPERCGVRSPDVGLDVDFDLLKDTRCSTTAWIMFNSEFGRAYSKNEIPSQISSPTWPSELSIAE